MPLRPGGRFRLTEPFEHASDLDDLATYGDRLWQVNVAALEADHLGPPQPRVGRPPDPGSAPLRHRRGQLGDLRRGQDRDVKLGIGRGSDATGWGAGDQLHHHGVNHHLVEDREPTRMLDAGVLAACISESQARASRGVIYAIGACSKRGRSRRPHSGIQATARMVPNPGTIGLRLRSDRLFFSDSRKWLRPRDPPRTHQFVRAPLATPHLRPAILKLPPPNPSHRLHAVPTLADRVLVDHAPAPTLLGE